MKAIPVLFLLLPSLSLSLTGLPNIVILLVDDLGIGDVGCFGNSSLPTPHIDQLCQTGAVLSHHVSPAVLCTPSRAALMTGRYAVRMGLTGSDGNYQKHRICWEIVCLSTCLTSLKVSLHNFQLSRVGQHSTCDHLSRGEGRVAK